MTKPSCHNRPAYDYTMVVQNGWQWIALRDEQTGEIVKTQVPVVKHISNPMSKDCQQIRPPHGEAYLHGWDCAGCRHLPATGMHPCHTSEPGECSWGSPSDPACTGCAKRG